MHIDVGFLAISYIFVMLAKKALSYNAAAYPPFSWRYGASLLAYAYLIIIILLVWLLGTELGRFLLINAAPVLVLIFGLYVFLLALCVWLLVIYGKKLVRDTRYYLAVEQEKTDDKISKK